MMDKLIGMKAENLRKCEILKLNFLYKVRIIFIERDEGQNHCRNSNCGKWELFIMKIQKDC